jgi:hypothetical protein
MDIYNKIYQLIGLSCIAITFVRFEPIKVQIQKLTKFEGKIWKLAYKLLSCSTCVGLWLGLGVTFSISDACIVSVMATYISYLTSRL